MIQGMSTAPTTQIPSPDTVRERIATVENELKALRRLLRASTAEARANEARRRRQQLEQQEGAGRAE
jgi:hypothetical protein